MAPKENFSIKETTKNRRKKKVTIQLIGDIWAIIYLGLVTLIILSYLCGTRTRLFIWWLALLALTLLLRILIRRNRQKEMANYYIIQEVARICFILYFRGELIGLILFFKMGLRPIIFWVLHVIKALTFIPLLWGVILQKIPILLIFLQVMTTNFLRILAFGVIFCCLSMFLVKRLKPIFILSSARSVNIIIFIVIGDDLIVIIFLLLYIMCTWTFLIFRNYSEALVNATIWALIFGLPLTFYFLIKITFIKTFLGNRLLVWIVVLSLIFRIVPYFNLIINYWLFTKREKIKILLRKRKVFAFAGFRLIIYRGLSLDSNSNISLLY